LQKRKRGLNIKRQVLVAVLNGFLKSQFNRHS